MYLSYLRPDSLLVFMRENLLNPEVVAERPALVLVVVNELLFDSLEDDRTVCFFGKVLSWCTSSTNRTRLTVLLLLTFVVKVDFRSLVIAECVDTFGTDRLSSVLSEFPVLKAFFLSFDCCISRERRMSLSSNRSSLSVNRLVLRIPTEHCWFRCCLCRCFCCCACCFPLLIFVTISLEDVTISCFCVS